MRATMTKNTTIVVGGGGSWGTDTYASTTYVSLWIQKISF
jgi:hypothetical protein